MMKLFRITYIDPNTLEPIVYEGIFEDTGTVTAQEWAEDHAYAISDKGDYTLQEIKLPLH